MSLIYNRVSDQRIRDHIDMLPDAEHTLEKYLYLGETQELSESNAAAFNPQPPTAPVHALRYKGKSQGKSSSKLCSSCGYKLKYDECKAKGEKCKKCGKIGHFAKVCISKSANNSQERSNNKSARFSGTRKVHMVTDDGEIEGTVDLNTAMERPEDVISCEFVGTIDVFVDEDTTSQLKGNLDVHTVHKPKRYQVFTKVSMYPTDKSGRRTGKPIEMKCKLDTGASVNVMPLTAYKLINPSEFDKDNKPIGGFGQDKTTLRGYSGNIIKQYGTRLIYAFWNNKYCGIIFHIVETQGLILLGLNAMRKFGLFTKYPRISIETVDLFPSTQNLARCETKEVTASQGTVGPVIESATGTKVTSGHMCEMTNNEKMYPECFTGIGKFKNFEYHINVDKNVKLVVHTPQKIALSLQGKLEKELEEMVRQGIIAPVEGHSDWVNSPVIREKPNGSLRICLDPRDLNKAIK